MFRFYSRFKRLVIFLGEGDKAEFVQYPGGGEFVTDDKAKAEKLRNAKSFGQDFFEDQGYIPDNDGGGDDGDLETMTVPKLKEMAKGLGIELVPKMNKSQIIAAILEKRSD